MNALLCTLLLAAAVPDASPAPVEPGSPPAPAPAARAGLDPKFVAGLVGEPRGTMLTGEALEARTRQVAALVRCPVCQGSSVADSPSETARNMKQEIHDLLARGFDEDQIVHYFELSYGEFIRLDPEAHGINWLVWLGPALALVLGGFLLRGAVRKMTRSRPKQAAAPRDAVSSPEDALLAAAVKRARELAYGWPGGEPPASGSGGA